MDRIEKEKINGGTHRQQGDFISLLDMKQTPQKIK
jgi:hypothetical protein